MDVPGMKRAGITPHTMGLHLAFVLEYAFTKARPMEDGSQYRDWYFPDLFNAFTDE